MSEFILPTEAELSTMALSELKKVVDLGSHAIGIYAARVHRERTNDPNDPIHEQIAQRNAEYEQMVEANRSDHQ